MTYQAPKESSTTELKYSEVLSWLLDFDGNEIDERYHGFIIPSVISSQQRVLYISDILGTRMWCNIDTEYIDECDFDSECYDSTHALE